MHSLAGVVGSRVTGVDYSSRDALWPAVIRAHSPLGGVVSASWLWFWTGWPGTRLPGNLCSRAGRLGRFGRAGRLAKMVVRAACGSRRLPEPQLRATAGVSLVWSPSPPGP